MAPPKSARDWWKAGNERGRHMGAREGSRGEKGREKRACEPSILTRKKGGFATAQAGECRRLHQSTCVECDGPYSVEANLRAFRGPLPNCRRWAHRHQR
jgi:hypothetical protein